MSADQGFIDLRLNRQEGQADEGFWPSFTDIMTVIVMIFLLAMVILLIRNMELVKQLRSTVQAQRQAAEFAALMGHEKDTVSERLERASRKLSAAHERIVRLEAMNQEQEAAIASQRRQLEARNIERTALLTQQEQLSRQVLQLEAELDTDRRSLQALQRDQTATAKIQQARIGQLRQQAAAAARALEASRAELQRTQQAREQLTTQLADDRAQRQRIQQQLRSALQRLAQNAIDLAERQRQAESARHALSQTLAERDAQLAQREQALAQALGRLKEADLSLSTLREDYGNLRLEYEDLIKPARSSEGRYTVEVQFTKIKGKKRIRFRDPAHGNFETLPRAALDKRLQAAQKDHPEGLYVRVIIPEDSGLSYNEAWQFTSQLHSAYDYYYQANR